MTRATSSDLCFEQVGDLVHQVRPLGEARPLPSLERRVGEGYPALDLGVVVRLERLQRLAAGWVDGRDGHVTVLVLFRGI